LTFKSYKVRGPDWCFWEEI